MIISPSILIFSGVRGDTRRYRTMHPYQQMGVANLCRQLSHLTHPKLETQFENAAIVILHRVPMNSQVEKLLACLHARGGLAIYDADDLIFDLDAFDWIDSPDFQDPIRVKLYKEDMLRYRHTLEACDAAMVSTDFLAQQVRILHKPVWIHRNAFSYEMLFYSEQARMNRQIHPGKVIIGYASGTPTHQKDFNLVRGALENLFTRYPQADLCLLGSIKMEAGWEQFKNKFSAHIQMRPRVPWRQLPVEMARWDINLAPLIMDNPFTQSKSEIKYMEAALVQVPTIASPTDAFQFAIRPGENGFLAANESEWLDNLEAMMHEDVRKQVGRLALEHVLANYNPEIRANQLVEVLNEMCRSGQTQSLVEKILIPTYDSVEGGEINPSKKSLWIKANEEDHPTLIELGIYNLRYRSLWTLIQQVWIFFRRLVAPIFPYRHPSKITRT
jgi:glycosyltransferase involved in cell wall biosynthesis